eukprot:Plantae.Rhodophyta-Purpureofilum_apyrenoidigerum.ctg7817.p1 GENE.Plantae.Rhodophyta-Purpureofilum_apyrenoidigerum.ctg7817~~Plantae.Rhodophyta-Purpureofilum_apyrenoidigerum.ctg7817.p1  ORF type:complete len:212 (+),score=21.97 Plantae.Rhodophyta-Purpureofilum_apyrenoidigerum.ctg7817:535-1170(+)
MHVFLYTPNLIGYARCILMAMAFLQWTQAGPFFTYYFISFCLDAADGYFARLMRQTSEFGSLLDMLTDRCGTAMLLTVLCRIYPGQAFIFLGLMFLDCFSHWIQMSSGLCSGTTSHKQAGNESALIRLYYTRLVLGFTCLFNELFFLMLHVLSFTRGPKLFELLGVQLYFVHLFVWGFCFPVFLVKQVVNVKQIVTAHKTLLNAPPMKSTF